MGTSSEAELNGSLDARHPQPGVQEAARAEAVARASWMDLARAVFPNSRAMTREERREFDATFWPDVTPLDVDGAE